MKKFNTFYVLLAVVLVIVILKTSCMGDHKQDETVSKSKAVLENIAERKSVRKYLNKSVEEDKIDAMVEGRDGSSFGNGQASVGIRGRDRSCSS